MGSAPAYSTIVLRASRVRIRNLSTFPDPTSHLSSTSLPVSCDLSYHNKGKNAKKEILKRKKKKKVTWQLASYTVSYTLQRSFFLAFGTWQVLILGPGCRCLPTPMMVKFDYKHWLGHQWLTVTLLLHVSQHTMKPLLITFILLSIQAILGSVQDHLQDEKQCELCGQLPLWEGNEKLQAYSWLVLFWGGNKIIESDTKCWQQ